MQQLQELRKHLVKEICDDDGEALSEGKHSFDDLSDDDLNNLIVDDKHGLIYCYIPKVIETHTTPHDLFDKF